ncbi:hypothetical protein J6590_101945 [Homalodisca vitripennis]|nr:hypothetical protein J6590_101945 [Homalodisca vitripennis]
MELRCSLQMYEWGKVGENSEAALLARANNPSLQIQDLTPYAELWMGTHPNGPSRLASTGENLHEWIQQNPQVLGEPVRQRFGVQLPFLFKVLSVNKALSIQVHPSKSFLCLVYEKTEAPFKRFVTFVFSRVGCWPNVQPPTWRTRSLCRFFFSYDSRFHHSFQTLSWPWFFIGVPSPSLAGTNPIVQGSMGSAYLLAALSRHDTTLSLGFVVFEECDPATSHPRHSLVMLPPRSGTAYLGCPLFAAAHHI